MVTQDEAFRGGQDPGSAKGVGVNTRPTGNITQHSLIQPGSFRGVIGALSDVIADREKRALGADLEKAVNKLKTINNPITQEVLKNDFAVRLAKIHGAANLGIIKTGLNLARKPEVRVNLNKGTLLIHTPTGETREEAINGVNSPIGQAIQTYQKIGARFKANLPASSKILDDIVAKSNEYRAKNGLPSIGSGKEGADYLRMMVDLANPISAFEKAQATITALRANPQYGNLFGLQEYTNQVYSQALGTVWLGMGRFVGKNIMDMLGNRRAYNVTDSQMSAFFGQYISDVTQAIHRFGAMTGMDQSKINATIKDLTGMITKMQAIYTSQYTGRHRQVALLRSELSLERESKQMAAVRALDSKMKKELGFGFYDAKEGASTFQRLSNMIQAWKQVHTDLGGKVNPRAMTAMLERFVRTWDMNKPLRTNVKDVLNRGVKSSAEGNRLYHDMNNMMSDVASMIGPNLIFVREVFLPWLEREKKALIENKYMNGSMINTLEKRAKAILSSVDKYDKNKAAESRSGVGAGISAAPNETTSESIRKYMGLFGGMQGLETETSGN